MKFDMQKLKNMRWTIQNKLRAMLGLALGGLVIIAIFVVIAFLSQEKANDQSARVEQWMNKTRDIHVMMANTRTLEQQYLANPSQKLEKQIYSNIKKMKETAQSLQKRVDQAQLRNNFTKIEKGITEYEDAFKRLAVMTETIGYTPDQGLRKTMTENLVAFNRIITENNLPELERQLYLIALYEKMYMVRKDEESYESHEKAVEKFRDMLNNSNLSSEDKSFIATNLLKYTSSFDTVHSAYNLNKQLMSTFAETAQNVEKQVDTIVSSLENERSQLIERQNDLQLWLIILLTIVGLLVVALLIVFGTWLIRSINRSIVTLKEGANRIGEGELGFRVRLNTGDELEAVAHSFNTMAENMQQSLMKVRAAAGDLSSSSQNLAAVSQETTAQANEVNEAIAQVSLGAQNQAEHLEESTELIATVTKALKETAVHGDEISSQAENAQNEGKNGLDIVRGLSQTSSQFVDLASRLVTEVKNTNEQSKQIQSIVSTIKEIAGNTDLLALNAAIESARAGEAGRGFAVVAREIRKLAERSKDEAQNIQTVVQKTSEQMGRLLKEAEQLNEFRTAQDRSVNDTKNAFDTIVASVSAINRRMEDAKKAIARVQDANSNLSAKLEEVSAISEQSAASAQQVTASSENQKEAIEQVNEAALRLQEIARDLQQEVERFRIENEMSDIGNDDENTPSTIKIDESEKQFVAATSEFAENQKAETSLTNQQ